MMQNRGRKRRKLLKILNSKIAVAMLIFLFLLGVLFAGNVIIKEGSVILDNDFNSSGVLFVNSTSGKVGIGISNPTQILTVEGDTNITESLYLGGTNISGAWTSFTPSWTNLAVGNGTNQGYYKQIGKTVFFRVRFIFAADSSISGAPVLSLPVTIRSYGTPTTIGTAMLHDATGNYHDGHIIATGIVQGRLVSGTNIVWQNIAPTVPFTWTTNDEITMEGFYEAA